MDIKEITDQQIWETHFNTIGSPSFHQSWEWGEFQRSLGYDILRLGLYDNIKLIAIALVIKIKSKRGKYLFIPHGPLFDIPSMNLAVQVHPDQKEKVVKGLSQFTTFLSAVAKKEGFWFIRMAPLFQNTPEHEQIVRDIGYRTAPIYVHAETMWVVDLRKTEEELLNDMRKTTRYLVRRGIKDGIEIHHNDHPESLDVFWKLYEETFTREDFTPFSRSYIGKEFTAFQKDQKALFFLGEIPPKFAQEGASRYQAGSLVVFTKASGFYHQGASIHSKIPVPYVLQWQSMLEAKKRGCQYYNFYGIYHPGRAPKAWQGLTLFKQGFGGFEVQYLPTQDYVISPKYYLSFAIDKYLAWKRGI
jgi:lipid II:glycine glycyltransferase (peptidoglycan interpeptide bridge formation enzyme)